MRRAFTLVEIAVVVALLAILTALAVPGLQRLARHARALEDARVALAALTDARALAQRENRPVQVELQPRALRLSLAVTSSPPESLRKHIDSFELSRTVPLGDGAIDRIEFADGTRASAGSVGAQLRFCPTTDTQFRIGTDEVPACGVGNIASHDALVIIQVLDEAATLRVRAALGTVDLP